MARWPKDSGTPRTTRDRLGSYHVVSLIVTRPTIFFALWNWILPSKAAASFQSPSFDDIVNFFAGQSVAQAFAD